MIIKLINIRNWKCSVTIKKAYKYISSSLYIVNNNDDQMVKDNDLNSWCKKGNSWFSVHLNTSKL